MVKEKDQDQAGELDRVEILVEEDTNEERGKFRSKKGVTRMVGSEY